MYEFYRQSLIGKALQDVLQKKVNDNEYNRDQVKKILDKFDVSIPNVFSRTVKTNVNFKGVVKSYNHVDGVWKFSTTEFAMTMNSEFVRCDFVKIVACDADTNMETGRRRRGRKSAQ